MFNTSGNPLQIGWIDYSPEHRRKVMTVLQSLAAPGAVDEIGIGQIRDGFSHKLFPGTSTIQTRAKYFFLVPYILMELEKQKNITPNALIQKLNDMELELIEPLLKSGEKGVIGETAGKNLKRKPSSVYWSGLKTFGILRYPHLSLEDYARAVCAVRKENLDIRSMGVSEDVSSQGDDSDAAGTSLTGGFWRCPPPPENWREHISIHLTYEEALHLKQCIIRSSFSKDSLLAFLLQVEPEVFTALEDFGAIGEALELPESIRQDFEMARDFSRFIFGASLRYNLILSEGRNEKARQLWTEWLSSYFVTQRFEHYEPVAPMDYLQISNPALRRFLTQWKKYVLAGNEEDMDSLIVQREIDLKGRQRAKLRNSALYSYKVGDGLRGGKLDFRYSYARDILTDIFKALEGSHAQAG
ncbi:DUF6361 family protein [Desulfonatronovibrio magnus]|uniref:DUF6361 family protein n=1 Tax=Desulfonatronovibrio magnus TaxID=698827 RepID=UPI0005EBA610|nr:DUF6361 family protein [Desulfonatronovibrio magnus]